MRVSDALVIAVAALVSATSLNAHACDKASVMSATDVDGRKLELLLDSAQVENTPQWSPGSSEPPLSISQATEIAFTWAKERYDRFDVVEVREISLTSLGCVSSRNHWYYIFDFVPVMDGNRMYGVGNWIAVLMDGTVVGTTRAGEVSD